MLWWHQSGMRYASIDPTDATDGDLVWYTDGSVQCPRIPSVASAAAAIVVVNGRGELIAFTEIVLPSLVTTAPVAEALALLSVLGFAVGILRVIADCKTLLDTAALGEAAATRAGSAMAGIWSCISVGDDGNIDIQVRDGRLRCMPSRPAADNFGNEVLSDVELVKEIDWMANRLAEAIAKRCALRFVVGPRLQKRCPLAGMLATCMTAIRDEAAALGAVTCAHS